MKKLIEHRFSLGVLGLVVILAASMAGWAAYLQLTGNIYELEVGKIFRSGQLGAEQFQSFVMKNNIQTVINLRGENPNEDWFKNETRIATDQKITYISLPFSANNEPSDQLLASLIASLKTAKRPILIHCQGGADRTGLASALYELLIEKKSPDVAARQLSFRFGHFPWLISQTGAMDRAFWKFVNGTSSRRVFLTAKE